MIDLRSDNTAAAHPSVLAALVDADAARATSYGDDPWTERLRDRVRRLFEHPEAEVAAVATGTAANALSLASVCPPWGAVVCHDSAHIANHEGGATSHLSGGAVMTTLPGDDGHIDPAALRDMLAATWWGDAHQSQPAALSIVCPTDLGTVPGLPQIAELCAMAHDHQMRCHLDGARFANALATLQCTPADLTWRQGVDILSLGMTKNGGMNADLIVSFNAAASDELRFRAKRSGHVASKGRYLSIQAAALLDDDLWLTTASHANRMATRLADGLAANGVHPLHPVQANLVFVAVDADVAARIRDAGVEFFELRPGVARFVTSWQTTSEEVDEAISRIADATSPNSRGRSAGSQ